MNASPTGIPIKTRIPMANDPEPDTFPPEVSSREGFENPLLNDT